MTNIVVFKGEENLDLLNEIEKFRLRIWSKEVGLYKAKTRFCLNDDDIRSWHFVRQKNQSIIASGRLTVAYKEEEVSDICSFGPYIEQMNFPLGIMGRLVVDNKYRRQGVGKQLISARIEKAQQLKMREIWFELLSKRIIDLKQYELKQMGKSMDKSIPGDWQILVKRFE